MRLLGSSSTIGKALSGVSSSQLQSAMVTGEVLTSAASAGFNGYNGGMELLSAHYASLITKFMAEVKFSQGLGAIVNQMSDISNNALKDALTQYTALEQVPNYSMALFTEARAMLQENNKG